MCGIVGMFASEPVSPRLYDALTVLQHRGQDAAGIMTFDKGRFGRRKGNGLVRDVFDQRHIERLSGEIGIGHVRYPTAGCSSSAEAQPFFVNSPYGIALAHNGNLTNADVLRDEIYTQDMRHLNTSSDSEVLLNVLAHELALIGSLRPEPADILNAVDGVHARCRGAYAVVAMVAGYGLLAFRDPNGIRPLMLAKRDRGMFSCEWMVASESVAAQAQGYEVVRDVAPGEAIFIDQKGQLHTNQWDGPCDLNPCIFEQVYLARPDSVLDGVSVYQARVLMGRKLAEQVLAETPDHGIDVVMPVPDSGRTAALEMALTLGVPFREGLVKNRYIGRTFIMPGQQMRQKNVRQKLNAVEQEFAGKTVCLVDDSVVRGTTCRQIIQMAREAGATKVVFASAAPPVRHPNVYGIDMPAAQELVAYGRSIEEVANHIGADRMLYQTSEGLKQAVQQAGGAHIAQFDCSVFDGTYVTGDVDADYFERLEASRNDAAKLARDLVDLGEMKSEATDSAHGLDFHG